MSKQQGHHAGHTHKHTSAHKHSGTRKHHPAKHHPGHGGKGPKVSGGPLVVAKHPHHAKARRLAVPPVSPGITPFASRGRLDGPGASLADWDACTAIALGASLRLAGWPVGDADVLALHVAAGGSRDVGVTIEAALQAAAVHGLAGIRPRWFWPTERGGDLAGRAHDLDAQFGGAAVQHGEHMFPFLAGKQVGGQLVRDAERAGGIGALHGLIVGAELPGPHALALDGPGAWSWGEWHPWSCFPAAVVEEAWAVVWPC